MLLNPVWMKGKERLLLKWTHAQKSVTSLKTNQDQQNRGALSDLTQIVQAITEKDDVTGYYYYARHMLLHCNLVTVNSIT